MIPDVQSWQTTIMSMFGLLVGAALAVIGALSYVDSLLILGTAVIGGGIGTFVPGAWRRGLPPGRDHHGP